LGACDFFTANCESTWLYNNGIKGEFMGSRPTGCVFNLLTKEKWLYQFDIKRESQDKGHMYSIWPVSAIIVHGPAFKEIAKNTLE
jgi:hypothetical protein